VVFVAVCVTLFVWTFATALIADGVPSYWLVESLGDRLDERFEELLRPTVERHGEVSLFGGVEFALVRGKSEISGRTGRGGRDGWTFDLPSTHFGMLGRGNGDWSVFTSIVFGGGLETSENTAWLGETYVVAHHLTPYFGARLGRMSLPFSLEHRGALRVNPYFVTSAAASSYLEELRFYGLEVFKAQCPPGKHFDIRVGFGTQNESYTTVDRPFSYTDSSRKFESELSDNGLAWYLRLGKEASNSCGRGRLSWHVGAFDGGGGSRFLLVDSSFARQRFRFNTQLISGNASRDELEIEDFEAGFVRALWHVTARSSFALRFDEWRRQRLDGSIADKGCGLTIAWSKSLKHFSALQFEYLDLRSSTGSSGGLLQARYRVHF